MCGLVGIIARRAAGFFQADMDLMQNLLLLDTIRGEDSTGVYTIMRDGNATITKVGSHPLHLFTTVSWGKHKGKATSTGRIMIGHNRKATMGTVNSANAHPFAVDHIILSHNGTLREDHKKLADVQVDSHAVAHAFAEKGAEEVLKTLVAAFAFIWWDAKKNKLFAVRNDERPLSVVVTEELYILCSEPWMATSLVSRMPGRKVDKVIDIKPGQLYEFTLDGKMSESTIELRKPTPVTTNYTGHRSYPGHYGRDWADMEDESLNSPKPVGSTPNGGTNTPFKAAADALVEQAQRSSAPGVTHPEYKKDDVVLVQINDVEKLILNDKHKVKGLIIEPGRTAMDFVGFLPASMSKEAVAKLVMGTCQATIISFSNSLCGYSAWMTKFEPAPSIKVHNTDLAVDQWNYVLKEEVCKDCASILDAKDAYFTSVTRRGNSDYRVTCADCIQDKLTGAMQDEFKQRRADAVQDGIAISQKPSGSPLVLVSSKGDATIH